MDRGFYQYLQCRNMFRHGMQFTVRRLRAACHHDRRQNVELTRDGLANPTKHLSDLLVVLLLLTCFGYIGTPAYSQCAGTNPVTPVTSADETSTIPASRMLVNGTFNFVNTSTPGQISIEVPSTKRTGTWAPIVTNATALTAVNITAPTTAGTAATNSGASGILVKYPTTAVSANIAGVRSTSFTDTEYQMKPVYACRFQTGSVITSQRIWAGLGASALNSAANPTTPAVNSAAFRFDTSVPDTTWKCYTSNGTTNTVTSTSVVLAASTTYDLLIDMSNSSQILFYINGALVATVTTNLPGATTTLGPQIQITTLSAAIRDFSVGTMRLESY
jgi:hypothetical protein